MILKSKTAAAIAIGGFGALTAGGGFASIKQVDAAQKVTSPQAAFFETKIRPLLSERCFSCHGADKQSGGLRLDSADSLRKGGGSGAAIIAGDFEKSPLIRNIRYDGPVKMPPGGKLRPDEIAALTEWVKMGAPWPEVKSGVGRGKSAAGGMVITDEHKRFWSFLPIQRPAIPKVKNTAWVRNPIDAFVLSGLEPKGLRPSPLADKRALIRRAYFDLIGLPPSPEEVDSYLSDPSERAYEKVIDRLLASPHYGERWGRHWLDVARYADSNGLDENKAFAHAFRYRDYVVNAFNRDKPYDRFLTEQLAGDLLPADSDAQRNEQITATGFLVLGAKVLAEQDKPKFVMDIVDEQIEVASKAFMGLTIACARCHDHKFDPITTKDYYALAGIFKSTRTMKDLGFVSNWMEKQLLTDEVREQQKQHDLRLRAARTSHQTVIDSANEGVLQRFRKDTAKYLLAGWELSQQDGVLSIAEIPAKPGDTRMFIEAENFARATGIMVESESYGKGIGVIINNAVRDEIEWDITVPADGTHQIELRYAASESRPVKLLLNGVTLREKTAGQDTGSWNPEGQRWEPQGVFAFRAGKNILRIERDGPIPHFDKILVAPAELPKGRPARSAAEIAKSHGIEADVLVKWAQRLRLAAGDPVFGPFHSFAQIESGQFAEHAPKLSVRYANGEPSGIHPSVKAAFTSFKATELADIAALYQQVLSKPGSGIKERFDLPEKPERFYSAAEKVQMKNAEESLKAVEAQAPAVPIAMAVEEGSKPENVRVHVRGSTLSLGDEVPRRFLTVLNGDRNVVTRDSSGRLQLSQWLTNPSHPLTSRVAVNRIWQGHFGEGLVRTPDNWGLLGEQPTHPELLDWLAAEFMSPASGSTSLVGSNRSWSMKRLHRLIMTSNTYRMSTTRSEKAFLADPENRLLWRMNRRRLEAEPFRDSLLVVSGNLDRTMGGTLLTTKNNDYVTNDQSGNAARYDNHRRSIYLPVIRNAVFDMFQAFDFGDPTLVNAKRASTTVAPQALYIMNSAFAIEQARGFAKRLLADSGLTDAQRIRLAYLIAYSRPAVTREESSAQSYLTRIDSALSESEPESVKRRVSAWTSLCQVILASNEFIYVK